MIRRGFWLATGVVLGVTGYRRLTRLANELTGPRTTAGGPQLLAPPRRPSGASVARVVAAAKFVRDVRDGMAEYRDLHPREDTPREPATTTGSSESQQNRRES
jgi:hypothetical protein